MKASINGMTMWYEDLGTGPAVLLLHGFPFERDVWKDQIEPLRRAGYRVIVPDLRGFGGSNGSAGDYSLDILGDDLIDLLNYLGIGRTAIVALSLGGLILNDILKRYSSRVAAAAFIDTPGVTNGHAKTRCLLELTAQLRAGSSRQEVIEALADALFSGPYGPCADAVRRWVMSADDRMLEMVVQAMRDLRKLELEGFHTVLPVLRLRDWRFLEENEERGSIEGNIGGSNSRLFDFLRGIPRWQPLRQVAIQFG